MSENQENENRNQANEAVTQQGSIDNQNNIHEGETLNSLRQLYMDWFSKRINVLFQTLGIMMVLFIPIYTTIRSSLTGEIYLLYLIALLFLGLSFFLAMENIRIIQK